MKTSRLEDIKGGVSPKTCMKCHDGEDGFEKARPVVMLDSSFRIPRRAEKGSLKFSHKAHVGADVDCSKCHGETIEAGVVPSATAARFALQRTTMKSCMQCHVKEQAETSCLTCHDKVSPPTGHMNAFWMRSEGHGLQSSLKTADCAVCHDKTGQVGDCADCHMGTDARKMHGAIYRYSHGTDVKFKKMDCATCHQPLNQFCGDCHEGKGRPAR
jgi:hypothetical protein